MRRSLSISEILSMALPAGFKHLTQQLRNRIVPTINKSTSRFSSLLDRQVTASSSVNPPLSHRATDRKTNQAERGTVKSPGHTDRWLSVRPSCRLISTLQSKPPGWRTDGFCFRSRSCSETVNYQQTQGSAEKKSDALHRSFQLVSSVKILRFYGVKLQGRVRWLFFSYMHLNKCIYLFFSYNE